MSKSKLEWIKEQIHINPGQDIEITGTFLREIIEESRGHLAHHPIDLMTEDFARDLLRLAKYLNVDFEQISSDGYRIVPV